jgi:hypothetical protein
MRLVIAERLKSEPSPQVPLFKMRAKPAKINVPLKSKGFIEHRFTTHRFLTKTMYLLFLKNVVMGD